MANAKTIYLVLGDEPRTDGDNIKYITTSKKAAQRYILNDDTGKPMSGWTIEETSLWEDDENEDLIECVVKESLDEKPRYNVHQTKYGVAYSYDDDEQMMNFIKDWEDGKIG